MDSRHPLQTSAKATKRPQTRRRWRSVIELSFPLPCVPREGGEWRSLRPPRTTNLPNTHRGHTETNRWLWRGDGPRQNGGVVLLTVIISKHENNKLGLTEGKFQAEEEEMHVLPDSPAGLKDNAWYATTMTTSRKVTNQSCYACAQLPHGVGNSIPVKPRPINVSETLGALLTFTQGFPRVGREVKDMTKTLNCVTSAWSTLGLGSGTRLR